MRFEILLWLSGCENFSGPSRNGPQDWCVYECWLGSCFVPWHFNQHFSAYFWHCLTETLLFTLESWISCWHVNPLSSENICCTLSFNCLLCPASDKYPVLFDFLLQRVLPSVQHSFQFLTPFIWFFMWFELFAGSPCVFSSWYFNVGCSKRSWQKIWTVC